MSGVLGVERDRDRTGRHPIGGFAGGVDRIRDLQPYGEIAAKNDVVAENISLGV